jgi:hypothetical protein
MAELDTLLVDTTTLLSLDLSRAVSGQPTFRNPTLPQAIEALVLFEHITLDGPSVKLHEAELGWLMDIDSGVHVRDGSPSEIESLYLRAAALFQSLDWRWLPRQSYQWDTDDDGDNSFFSWFEQIASEHELGYPFQRHASFLYWADVEQYLSDHVSDAVASAFTQPLRSSRGDDQVNKIVGLVRLFYYLALQESVGGTLLLHGSRAFFGQPVGFNRTHPPHYSMLASQIFGVFSDQVQRSYLERRKRWLGSDNAAINVSFPLLAGFVQSQSERKGWSTGRTISWLREQHEVHLFRKGLRDLLKHLEAGDNLAVNTILEELDRASVQWCEKLDTPVRPMRKFSLQVALPFVQPATDIAIPMPARTPAQKMLVLISLVLRNSIGSAPSSS